MKNKMIYSFLILNTIISVSSFGSWWGDMSKGERASVIATGVLITNDRYNRYNNNNAETEAKHKQEMKDLENRLRQEFEEKLQNEKEMQNIKKDNPNKPVPIEENKEVNINKNNRYLTKEVQNTLEQSQVSQEEMEQLRALAEQTEKNNKEQ